MKIEKMLEAIKDCILSHNIMPGFDQQENVSLTGEPHVSLKEESWIYVKEIAILRKAIESSGSTINLKNFSILLSIFKHYSENRFRAVSLMDHCLTMNRIKKQESEPNSLNFNLSSDVTIKTDNTLIDSAKLQQIFIKT